MGPRAWRIKLLGFRGDLDNDRDPGFLNPNEDLDPGIFKRIFDELFRGVERGP